MTDVAPIRVAVVIPKYGLIGGAEGFAFELTERLAQHHRFDIHVLANKWRRGDSPITFHKVPTVNFPRWFKPLSFALFSQKIIEKTGFDLIHSHERIFASDIFTFHGIPHKTWVKEVRNKRPSLFDITTSYLEKKLITCAKTPTISAVSSLVKKELLKIYDIPEKRIQVSHPGVSMERFKILDKKACREEILNNHGLKPNDVVALFVGMNFEIKGLDLILNGISNIAKENKESRLKLLVVGRGNEAKFSRMAKDLDIADRVIFAGSTREVEKYYLAGDFFIMPSYYDTFGLVVLEAMAAGLPVIISETVGAKDLVIEKQNGLVLSNKRTLKEITDALNYLHNDANRIQMQEKCFQTARSLSWDNITRQMEALYLQVAEKSRTF